MATYFVASGGSNTSPYDTWAKAATSLQTALTAASSGTDVVVIQYNAVPSGDAELAADVDYTTTNSVRIISASNDGGSAYTPTVMGTANWIGNSTTNRRVGFTLGNDDVVFMYGLTLRVAGGAIDDNIRINLSNGADCVVDSCYLWQGNTNTTSKIVVGGNTSSETVIFKDCTFRFGATAQVIDIQTTSEFYNCSISSDGSTPTTLLSSTYGTIARVLFSGCDLSLVTGTLVGNIPHTVDFVFERCKLGSAVTILATQTLNPTLSSARAQVRDCASGDTHIFFGDYTALGSTVSDTGIYFTSGAAAQSWKIVTSANASYFSPYVSPRISLYHTGTSAITPYLEILHDGSATAYQNDEVWLEVSAKVTASSTKASFYSDRCTLANKLAATTADQAAGAGTGSWTGENATSWSGKIDSGSSITPAEAGHIVASICVGEPSITVYVDPQIRT